MTRVLTYRHELRLAMRVTVTEINAERFLVAATVATPGKQGRSKQLSATAYGLNEPS